MIQGGEHQVNRGWLGLALLLEMGFEIADGVIARVRVAERVAIIVGAGFEVGAILIYEYDFGDGWEHQVAVEKVLPPDSQKTYARCLDGKNNSPLEDCGDIFGYYDLLKAISNPKHPEHQQLLEWLGRPFDPNHFDLHRDQRHAPGFENLANYFTFH